MLRHVHMISEAVVRKMLAYATIAKAAAPAAAARAASLYWPKVAAALVELSEAAEAVDEPVPELDVESEPEADSVDAALVGMASVANALVVVAAVAVAVAWEPPPVVLAQLGDLGRSDTPTPWQILRARPRASAVGEHGSAAGCKNREKILTFLLILGAFLGDTAGHLADERFGGADTVEIELAAAFRERACNTFSLVAVSRGKG